MKKKGKKMQKKMQKKCKKKNAKNDEAKVFFILCFSRNQFLSNKKKFSPFFSETAGPIGLKFFYVYFSQIGVRVFFLLRNIVPIKFGDL